jgi:hypothetical protein
MSSTPPIEISLATLRPAFARLVGREATGFERIGGGRNSQVYRVDADGGQRFALKVYFRHAADKRDRLATEFGSFTYLWRHGIQEVPRPLAVDTDLGWAVYQFIEGERIPAGHASEAEVVAAANFLGRLRALSREPDSRNQGIASEAFFTVREIAENVRQRRALLREAEANPDYAELASLLRTSFDPLFERVTPWCEAWLQASGMSSTTGLDWPQRTLSPSDFGFHNALRRGSKNLIFLDFEYFGWDDPAKMTADFLLHPAMDLSAAAKRVFTSTVLGHFSDWPGLRGRLEAVYPLFGLKWCMILLNEFRPDQLLRRQFAANAPADRVALQRQQLEKARRMLDRIGSEYEDFPYRD